MNMGLNKLGEMVKDREAWHSAAHRVTESDTTEQLSTHTEHSLYNFTLQPWTKEVSSHWNSGCEKHMSLCPR